MKPLLIVDDERVIVQGLRQLLGYLDLPAIGPVKGTTSPREALRIANEIEPEIVITDVRMPYIDGFELIEKLRARGYQDTQYIVLSGYDEFPLVRQALQLHAVDYLLKPARSSELADAIKRAVDRIDRHKEEDRRTQRDIHALRTTVLSELLGHLRSGHGPSTETLDRAAATLSKHARLSGLECGFIDCAEETAQAPEMLESCVTQINREEEQILVAWVRHHGTVSFIAAATPAGDPHALHTFNHYLEQVLQNWSHGGRNEIAVSLSSSTTSVHQLVDAYGEAERTRCEKFFNGSGLYRFEHAGCTADERPLEDRAHQLQRALFAGNNEELRNLVATLLDEDSIRQRGGPNRLSSILHQIQAHVAAFCAYAGEIENCRLPDLFAYFSLENLRRTLNQELVRLAERRAEPATEHWIVAETRRYIYEKLAQQVDMRALAVRLGLSYAYFSALFKEKAGRSFSEELTRIRMDEAHRLLRNSHLGVEETAYRIGYQSPKHFSRTFKSHFGVPPSRVREQGTGWATTQHENSQTQRSEDPSP